MKFLDKWKRTVLILLAPILSYVLLGPLEIYFGNRQDLTFEYTAFFIPFLFISIIFLIIVSILLSLLPEKINRVIGAFIFGIEVASYIQNMFMNVKLIEANGTPMNWKELGNFLIINGIIYCAIVIIAIVLCFILKEHWNAVGMLGSSFLSIIQLIAIIFLLLAPPKIENTSTDLQESGEKQFQVASENNIIVFVLDTFGNEQFDSILEQYPEDFAEFTDFTYYNNADCHYYVTFPSMTHMLTGVEFDPNMDSPKQWMEIAWNSDRANKFYNKLKANNYECNIYSKSVAYTYGSENNLNGKFDNIKPMDVTVNTGLLMKKIGKMSIYRYVPYFIKPYFETLTKEFDKVVEIKDGVTVIGDNGEFYKILMDKKLSISKNTKNAFIIEHLFGTHQPYTIDENAHVVEEATVLETGRGLLTILREYFSQLKDMGVYDDSVIIIMADHGAWFGGDTQPIFLIKEKNESHDTLNINTAPISWDDFQATIMDILGEDYFEYGKSIYDWNEGDKRERTVYMINFDEKYTSVEGITFNVYNGYTYYSDKSELNKKVGIGPDIVFPVFSATLK